METPHLIFWAKTTHDTVEYPNAFHPLICHLIDVAAVTEKIWQKMLPKATRLRITNAFGLQEEFEAGRFVAFIAGLHDLGKCSPPFALRGRHENEDQIRNALEKCRETASYYRDRLRRKLQTIEFLRLYENTDLHISGGIPTALSVPHGYVTTIELPEILQNQFGFNPTLAQQIGIFIGGHHGVFPNSEWRKGSIRAIESNIGNTNWAKARKKLATSLAELLTVQSLSQNSPAKLDNGTIMILAGLVSVADWIGSDTNFFKCEIDDFRSIPDLDLKSYLTKASGQAETALKKLGWLDWPQPEAPKKFFELFPELEKFPPRDLQRQCISIVDDLKTAGIVVIEAPMGEGKTEAAMFLADAWNVTCRQRGIYFALPTQATSNQMFGRVKEFLGDRFDEGIVNLQLQHGHSSLSAEFATLKDDFREIQDIYDECSGDECVPQVVAAEWFTYRKRGLLAPFGVGTVDQALMAVLQTKHVFVRLCGLAHKTIIIDEVHAYDAYMSTLLERLLEWLAALGSPVILLSATLPQSRRNTLVKAYQKGLGINESGTEGVDEYPRISYATGETIHVRHVETSDQNRKTLFIKKIRDDFIEDLKAKLEETGGCVAIICNTVGRAQDVYERLRQDNFFKGDADDGWPKLDLLHSRFRFCDRDEIEKRVRIRFGKEGDTVKVIENGKEIDKPVRRPDFTVLVSTQIIEQSLDIDFDLMISDLAPIDLLLQRAGRLHRHSRNNRSSEFHTPTLWVIEPESKDNLPDFGVHKFVYDEHILLRTWLQLQGIDRIKIPEEIAGLIETVYDLDKIYENLGESLHGFWQKTLANCLKSLENETEQAAYRYIKRPSYSQHISGIFAGNLEEDLPGIHQTLQAITRLVEPTANVICLRERDDRVFLDSDFSHEIDLNKKPNSEETKELLRRSLSISNKSVVFKLLGEKVSKGWRESALLRNHRVLKFNEEDACKKFGHIFCLDSKLGLKIEG